MSLRLQGNTAYSNKDYDSAIALYSRSLDEEPSAAALANRAACYIQLKNWPAAAQDAQTALEMHPDSSLRVKLLYRLARALTEQGIDANRQINLGLESDPKNPELLKLRSLRIVPIHEADTLPDRYAAKLAPSPQAEKPQTTTFLAPKLPLTYASIINVCRDSSPAAYDWWYSIDPQQLVTACRGVGIEPSTLEYLRNMVNSKGGEQGQRLLDATRRCDGYAMADMMCL